ncbi:hypothetical protein [Kitasatospora sp. NPDC050543]|uniref:hypothetical protein n=1 Tax=Kitasatospora sp. NPDC050543 TaxID=3364054 RepID=UPI0037AF3D57
MPILAIGAVVMVILLTLVYLRSAPAEACRECRHRPAAHRDGVGRCKGDDFDRRAPKPNGRTCSCLWYR